MMTLTEDQLVVGWMNRPLKDLVDILDSRRVPVNKTERDRRPGLVPYYGATGQVGWIDKALFDEELLLLGEDGVQFLDPTKPKAYMISGPSWVNNHAHVLRARMDLTSNRYLTHYLNRFDYRGYVNGTTRLKLTQNAMRSIPVFLPDRKQQEAIVDEIEKQFTRLDAAGAALQRTQTNMRRFRASIFHAACAGRLSGGGSREGWTKATVGELAELVQYGTSAKMHKEAMGVPVLRMGNIESQGTLRLDSLKFLPSDHDDFPGLILEQGDVLFNRTNSAELVGKSAVYKGDPSPCSFASYLIRVRFAPDYMPEFFVYYLNSGLGRAWIRSVVSQQVGQANISGGKLRSLEVPVPPLSEQKRIVAEVERQLSIVRELEVAVGTELGHAGSLRRSVLSEAFSGRLITNESKVGPSDR